MRAANLEVMDQTIIHESLREASEWPSEGDYTSDYLFTKLPQHIQLDDDMYRLNVVPRGYIGKEEAADWYAYYRMHEYDIKGDSKVASSFPVEEAGYPWFRVVYMCRGDTPANALAHLAIRLIKDDILL